MNSSYQTICEKVNKKTWITPALLGICGGVVGSVGSNLSLGGQIIFQALYWTIGYKIALITAGAGFGWKIGNSFFDANDAISELVDDPNCWNLIMTSYVPSDTKIKFKRSIAIEALLDSRNDIGKLYQFCIFLFIEKYEHFTQESQLMNEFKCLVRVLTAKHPMYTCEHFKELEELIERRCIQDLYPYIYSHYLINNKSSHKKIDPLSYCNLTIPYVKRNQIKCYNDDTQLLNRLENDLKQIDPEKKQGIMNCLQRSSNVFRQLPNVIHPKDKAVILIDMVKEVSEGFQKIGIQISCDHLIPIISHIIMKNIDIVPGADIRMAYDYLGHLPNEEAYVATVLLSSLMACVEDKPSIVAEDI